MDKYEFTFITSEKESAGIKTTQNLIQSAGGSITSRNSLEKRSLSYPIKGITRGYYHVWSIVYPCRKLTEFNQKLHLDQDIIRYLILKKN